jgi:hypothetical protein
MRHPLDFSAPRISDLPADEAKAAMLERDAAARAAWWAGRQRRPLGTRIRDLLLPPASAAHPPAASTPLVGAFEARADHIAGAGNMVGEQG